MRQKARPTTKADETPEFQAFWDAWRPHMNRNDGRGAARDEFFRHVEEYGADPRDLADGAAWFIRGGGNQGTEWKVHASTWLNRRAYEDGAELERQYRQRQAEAAENVVQMPQAKPALPANHFSRRWERGEFDKQFKQG